MHIWGFINDFEYVACASRKSVKLYSDFYSSDIIIASPLGLVTVRTSRRYKLWVSFPLLVPVLCLAVLFILFYSVLSGLWSFSGGCEGLEFLGTILSMPSEQSFTPLYNAVCTSYNLWLLQRIEEAESAKKEDKQDIDFLSSIEVRY